MGLRGCTFGGNGHTIAASGIDEHKGIGMSEQGKADADKAAALMSGIRARYGEGLTEEQMEAVGEGALKIAATTGLLRGAALDNGDIPFVATPYRAD